MSEPPCQSRFHQLRATTWWPVEVILQDYRDDHYAGMLEGAVADEFVFMHAPNDPLRTLMTELRTDGDFIVKARSILSSIGFVDLTSGTVSEAFNRLSSYVGLRTLETSTNRFVVAVGIDNRYIVLLSDFGDRGRLIRIFADDSTQEFAEPGPCVI